MPLSEEELRLLEQMERALSEEDPKFASTLRGTSMRRAARRNAIIAGVVFVVGVALLMSGAVTKTWPLGILGFVVMLASATFGLNALNRQRTPAGHEAQQPAPEARATRGFTVIEGSGRGRGPKRSRRPSRQARGSKGSFMERMEERWRHRRDEPGF